MAHGTPIKPERQTTCSIHGCTATFYGRGYCHNHWDKLRRYGSPDIRKHGPYGQGCLNGNGYRMISRNGHQVLEHRDIMETHLGRRLGTNEVVHHVNKDRLDNRLENLRVMTRREHYDFHFPDHLCRDKSNPGSHC